MTVDRSKFTPDGSNPPVPVPFGLNQTVPTEQMAIVLRDLLATDGDVLEVGTGSGYQTAVLAEKCKTVISIDFSQLPAVIAMLPQNVVLLTGDGTERDTGEQFDGILVTFAAERIYPAWLKQLKHGARLVVPLKISNSSQCRICVYVRNGEGISLHDIHAYAPFTAQRGTS